MTKKDIRMKRSINGHVRWEDDGEPVGEATVLAFRRGAAKPLAKSRTSKAGAFSLEWKNAGSDKEGVCPVEIVLEAINEKGRRLASTGDHPLLIITPAAQVDLLAAASARSTKNDRPKMKVGPLLLDAQAVARTKPQIVLDIAKAMVDASHEKKVARRIAELSPDLIPSEHVKRTLCGTAILEVIDELIRIKKWPREIGLQVEDILGLRNSSFAQVHLCTNFQITYQDSGPDAVDPDTSAMTVNDPGSNPAVVLTTLPAGGAPTYVKLICFWLERALATYVNAPFSMRNPAAGGRIPVVVNSAAFGSANASAFFINKALPPEVLCAVAVHELFHMVQFQYSGSGTWLSGMLEGGAVFAEDSSADFMNRYADEAGTNFNGSGYMVQPQTSLENFVYKTSLFFRYIAEQQSARTSPSDEPLIGVETYRKLIEECEAGTWSSDDIRRAIRDLPWYQDFYEFSYLDAAALDQTSSETVLGNFVLAAYLKDLGTAIPDRRFDFMEDEENIHIDDVIATILPGTPLQNTLASVQMSGTGTLSTTASVNFTSSVPRFGSRYHEVIVNAAVTSLQVQFTASGGLTSSLLQIALVDQDDQVREIYRSDRASYTKQFPNLRDGKRLKKIMVVATGAASAGNFSIAVNPVAATSDVMVTRWHSVMKNEYLIDSRNWAWTWVSPDIWVDNDMDGIADGIVYFNVDNKLHIRLHNKGNQAASAITVECWYQDASGGLSPTGWLPVQNTGGVTQTLTALSLAAGSSNDWTVDWSPAPSGSSHHFCIRAIVNVPGDPNTDNKRVLSNFGNVQVAFGGFIDLPIWRRNLRRLRERIELSVIPRNLPSGCELSGRDLHHQRYADLNPGEAILDTLRIHYPQEENRPATQDDCGEREIDCPCKAPVRAAAQRPDPAGNYPTDPRSLPPGLVGKPLITVVHLINGLPQGGATFFVDIKGKKKAKPASKKK